MPFRKAWLYVLALLALTFVAFWPGYFSQLPVKKLAHHYHAASAVLWMILAIVQSWTAHHNRLALHRKTGLAIFLLFPFFLVAGMWVIHVEATTLAGDFTSVEGMQIAQFGFFDPLANIAFALLFWAGLKYRYKVQLHARYMLATLLFVIAPVGFRLLAIADPVPQTGGEFFLRHGGWKSDRAGRRALPLPPGAQRWPAVPDCGGVHRRAGDHFRDAGAHPGLGADVRQRLPGEFAFLLLLTGIASVGIAWHGWVAGARPVTPKAAVTGLMRTAGPRRSPNLLDARP